MPILSKRLLKQKSIGKGKKFPKHIPKSLINREQQSIFAH